MNSTLNAAIKHYKETHATFVQEEFEAFLQAARKAGMYWSYEPCVTFLHV